MSWVDYVPGASNVKGIIEGDPYQAILGAGGQLLKSGYNAAKPKPVSTAPLDEAQQRAKGSQDYYRDQLVSFDDKSMASRLQNPNATRSQYDPDRLVKLNNLGDGATALQLSAARGTQPSAAELMLRDQASRNAAGSFGIAAAMQGRSPGMALRQATIGSVQTQAQAARDAGILRAKEMADARGGLVQAVGTQQNALNQTRALDNDARKTLVSADIGALDAASKAAGARFEADARNTAATNAFNGQLISTGASLATSGLGKFGGTPAAPGAAPSSTGLVNLAPQNSDDIFRPAY